MSFKLSAIDVRFLLQRLGPSDPMCDKPHPYMRFGNGLDPNAERWACTREPGHEGRCAMGPILFPEPESAVLIAPLVCADEPPPMPTWKKFHGARVRRLQEIYQREMFTVWSQEKADEEAAAFDAWWEGKP